jgi:hypothetical protein
MDRKLQAACAAFLALLITASAALAQGQQSAAVCVIVYQDSNQNGVRDPGEDAVTNINISLMIDSNVVIANYVTNQREPFCFNDLAPRQYALSLSSPFYQPLDPTPVTFVLGSGGRYTHEFGVVPVKATVSAPDPILYVPLTVPVRLGMSTAGALGMMALFSGFGLIIYGLFFHRRYPAPNWVVPPPWEQEASPAAPTRTMPKPDTTVADTAWRASRLLANRAPPNARNNINATMP